MVHSVPSLQIKGSGSTVSDNEIIRHDWNLSPLMANIKSGLEVCVNISDIWLRVNFNYPCIDI